MTKGKHGSTYGGNPLAVSVGREVLKIISDKSFLKNVNSVSRYLWNNLKKLSRDRIVEKFTIKKMINNYQIAWSKEL